MAELHQYLGHTGEALAGYNWLAKASHLVVRVVTSGGLMQPLLKSVLHDRAKGRRMTGHFYERWPQIGCQHWSFSMKPNARWRVIHRNLVASAQYAKASHRTCMFTSTKRKTGRNEVAPVFVIWSFTEFTPTTRRRSA